MLEKRVPIPVAEAVKKVMDYKRVGEVEYVPIEDCDNRFLAEPIIATTDIPPFDRAPYDGFAIRAEDTLEASQENPVTFEVIEEIGAGQVARKSAQPYQAIRIMTGALLPAGCDAVVMLELVQEYSENGRDFIIIKRRFQPGDNVSFQASETKKGEVLVETGRRINPGIKAVLATFGYSKVPVVKQPVISLYVTGTELLDVSEPLQPGKIRNSNSYMVQAQIKRTGAICDYRGKLIDDFELCLEAIKKGIAASDILITTGGVSVGDFDYLPEIYEQLGAKILFNKIAMRPGSVTTVAVLENKLLFGLSGNPSACFVGFELFVRPIIRSWHMSEKPHLRKVKAELDVDFPKANPFTRFVRSKLEYRNANVCVAPSGLDKSNVVTSLVDCNALMMLPGGTRGFKKGDVVDVLLLEDSEGSEWPWQ